jgi:hypothetical protein
VTLEPKVREQIAERVAQRFSDKLKAALRKSLEEGWLIFSKGKPEERLRGYMAGTRLDELPMILDPEYHQKMRVGLYPLPMQPCNAQVMTIMGEQGFCAQPLGHADPMMPDAHTPDMPQPFTNFWFLISTLPWWKDWSPWEYFVKDFSRLLEAEVLKLRDQAAERGLMV